jgi:5-enolpyruvylshikimate-3-phosphate synthase
MRKRPCAPIIASISHLDEDSRALNDNGVGPLKIDHNLVQFFYLIIVFIASA